MKRAGIIILMIISSIDMSAQDCLRLTYLYLHKNEAGGNYKTNEMKVDYDGRTSFFYGESSFLKDSLNVLAFDKNGNIADDDAYAKRTRIFKSGTGEKSIIDFSAGTFEQIYDEVAFFVGSMPVELPQWDLGADEVVEVAGYQCKKATGTFMGRNWEVYYTEDVPVSVGPWFLWGTPGMIVSAKDSEKLIEFQLIGVSKITESRLEKNRLYWQQRQAMPRAKVFSMKMKDMEKMHNRYRRDTEYFNTIHGVTGGYILDRNGNKTDFPKVNPYIPIITDEFWTK